MDEDVAQMYASAMDKEIDDVLSNSIFQSSTEEVEMIEYDF